MSVTMSRPPKNPGEFPEWRFDHLDIEYDAETRAVWMNYKSDAPRCFTHKLLMDLIEFRDSLRNLFECDSSRNWPIHYLVMASKMPGVFSLGGDLATFAAAIRKQDKNLLVGYAHACVDLVFTYSQGLGLPIVTLSAVHGQCLGGAFEAALAFDFILAEESAKFGLPEVMFNTFPGMGAVTLLTRKVGPSLTEKMIMDGRTYSGQEMYDLHVIDALAQDGMIRQAAQNWLLDGGDERWRRRRSISEARKRYFPVLREELIRITELWAECSCDIEEQDLRHMERLVQAQKRLTRSHQVDCGKTNLRS